MNLITAAAGLSARLSPGLVAVLLAAAGIQTLRLADETTAHAQTKAQWAVEAGQSARQIARLGEKYRATESALKGRADAALDSYLLAAEQGQLARADAVRAVERLRQLSARIADGAAGLPTAAAGAGFAGADCGAQLATCGRLLAEGAGLVAEGGELAAEGSDLAGRLDQKVTLCRAAWPSDKGLNPAQNLTAP